MPIVIDVFVVVLLVTLQVGIALAAFFALLTGYLPPKLRLPTRIALAVQWLVLLGFAFFLLHWVFGLVSLVLTPLYAFIARPFADRYAARFQRR